MPYKDPLKEKECQIKWRKNNKQYFFDYFQTYGKKLTEKQKSDHRRNHKIYLERNKSKIKCRRKFIYAVNSGKLKRPQKCSSCGGKNPEGHHPDYNKPLEVIWLCKRCHSDIHCKY